MKLDTRVERLWQALSAQERAGVLLRQLKSGGEIMPDVLRNTPSEQARELNHYLSLIHGVNFVLRPALSSLVQQVDQIELSLATLDVLRLWGLSVAALRKYEVEMRAALVDCAVPANTSDTAGESGTADQCDDVTQVLTMAPHLTGKGPWRRRSPTSRRSGKGNDAIGDRIWEVVIQALQHDLACSWGRLLALDQTTNWLGHELGVDDPLTPELRATLEQCRERLVEYEQRHVAVGGARTVRVVYEEAVASQKAQMELLEQIIRDRV